MSEKFRNILILEQGGFVNQALKIAENLVQNGENSAEIFEILSRLRGKISKQNFTEIKNKKVCPKSLKFCKASNEKLELFLSQNPKDIEKFKKWLVDL